MFIDSHAHITDDKLFGIVDAIIQNARLAKVEKIVNICTDIKTLERGIELQKRHPNIYNVGATTPHDVETDGAAHFDAFEKAARDGHLNAIGETGLDYFYEHSNRELQQEFLIRYFNLATELNLPVVIHCRDAFDDLFALADQHYKGKLLLHCFTGTTDEAKRALDRGFFLSISGIATFKRSTELRETIKTIPLTSLTIETDSPYLAPQSKRGKMCEPAFVVETAQLIAELKNVSLSEVAETTSATTKAFFSIP
ncbi:MAG: TatD family hydrolase [Simkaniaceae bacterium]|nr:TatD family hydrolase [Simkaniaceae bacterium]